MKNLRLIGLWEYQNKVGIVSTDNVFVYLSRSGQIETIRMEEEPRFVGNNWGIVVNAIKNLESEVKLKKFSDIIPDLIDAIEEFVIEDHDEYVSYNPEKDEQSVKWDSIPINVVYLSLLSSNIDCNIQPFKVECSKPHLELLLKSQATFEKIDLDKLKVSIRFHQLLMNGSIDNLPT